MRHHLKLFESEQAYREYKHGSDIWLPRVSFVPSTPTPIEQITMSTAGRLIFNEQGEHFIEICNNGQMCFYDKYDAVNDEWYRASVDEYGQVTIECPEDKVSYDENGVLNFTNFPADDDEWVWAWEQRKLNLIRKSQR